MILADQVGGIAEEGLGVLPGRVKRAAAHGIVHDSGWTGGVVIGGAVR